MLLNKNLPLFIIPLLILSCKEGNKQNNSVIESDALISTISDSTNTVEILDSNEIDSIQLSTNHKINTITCDLDGDNLDETIQIVRNTNNGKSGLKITYGNKTKIDYLGLGEEILNQGFDDLDWIGIFEVAPKNEIYFNNVSDEGEILSEEEVKDEDKIKLKNDGILIHAEESCGGGIIYLLNGKYQWIQQE